ncbi:hypothetical protein EVAR_64296_1 [Eumeta japonica]|uniref:Uncharacterized protein n=1 Tax=Eumeta variegata TaxID=151549 RepID=A0A4C1ZVN7_EUMVA|nr:hypothetical protein EVAR_64296_1 [Eumeta japonica]
MRTAPAPAPRTIASADIRFNSNLETVLADDSDADVYTCGRRAPDRRHEIILGDTDVKYAVNDLVVDVPCAVYVNVSRL